MTSQPFKSPWKQNDCQSCDVNRLSVVAPTEEIVGHELYLQKKFRYCLSIHAAICVYNTMSVSIVDDGNSAHGSRREQRSHA